MINEHSRQCWSLPHSYHILGKAGPSMQQDFYTVEDLATQLLGSAFVNLNNIPDFRLKSMLHILEMKETQKVRKLEMGQRERKLNARNR